MDSGERDGINGNDERSARIGRVRRRIAKATNSVVFDQIVVPDIVYTSLVP